jgi:hypothetical protein
MMASIAYDGVGGIVVLPIRLAAVVDREGPRGVVEEEVLRSIT